MFPIRYNVAANLCASIYVDIFHEGIIGNVNRAGARNFARQIEVVDKCAVQFVRRVGVLSAFHFQGKIDSRDDISFRIDAAQVTNIGAAIFAADAQRVRAEIKFNSVARRRNISCNV